MQDVKALIAGLGNPGPRYAANRHNLGFMLVDRLAEKHGWRPVKAKGPYELYDGELPGAGRAMAIKPTTFMNLSGEAVRHALAYFKLPASILLVAHDELDLPLGTVRLKFGGGAAGHNGIRSIMDCLGKPDFHRLRLGVGRPPAGWDVKNWVLADIAATERDAASQMIDAAMAATQDFFTLGPTKAMQRVNVAAKPPKPPKPREAATEADGKRPEDSAPPRRETSGPGNGEAL